MRILKRIDAYVIKNFLTLFFATFFICSFILIMQFLWMEIDEIVGKGLPYSSIIKFFFYAWLSLVPLALPLAILLASLMSFGNMGERLELLAMKSAGISLFRIMRTQTIFIAMISIGAFVFSNNVIPVAQKRMWALTFSIRSKSPELSIPVGEFYSGVNGMKIYVRGKNRDTGAMTDVMLYDFSKGFANASVTTADTVFVKMTEDKMNLKFIFINGETFENMNEDNAFNTEGGVPYRRETFKRREVLVDFDANFNVMSEEFLEEQHVAKNVIRLTHDIDSIKVVQDSLKTNYSKMLVEDKFFNHSYDESDSVKLAAITECSNADTFFYKLNYNQMCRVVRVMSNNIKMANSDAEYNKAVIEEADSYYLRHAIEWHRKFTLSFACLIFFFIGAPLGAIIRKGGLGMPVVISVLMFIVYYIIDTSGIKMAQEQVIPVWAGLWISSAVLLPIGIFLTYKAAKDSALFNAEAYKKIWGEIKILIARIKGKINTTKI